ncbi:hypothetical protein [Kitasatospora sp. NPDC094015]|uniref:hypothetical protein n=1 Tax=Kitasatospora sp. NPDC094015 TaxID=3155205 RepID=UPI003328D261
MRTTRSFDLAGILARRLAGVTGARARVRRRPEGGGYRVEVPLGCSGEAAHRELLAVLAGADRFGHRSCAGAQLIWAEVDDRPGAGTGGRTDGRGDGGPEQAGRDQESEERGP